MRALAGVVATLLALALAPVGFAAPQAYKGTSAISTNVGFTVSAAKVRGFAIGYVARCDNGETLRGTFRFKPVAVKSGRFAVRGPSSGRLADGRTTASNLRLSGELVRRRAAGAFSIATQMARSDGTGVTTCRSGRVTWKAARSQ